MNTRISVIPHVLLILALIFAMPAGRAQTATSSGPTTLTDSFRPVSRTPNEIGAFISRTALTNAELSAPITFNVSLPFRNLGELKARVDNHERLTTAQLEDSFFPLLSTYQRVTQWLLSQGLTVGPEDPNHTLVSVSGTIAQVSAAFQTTFAHVTSSKGEFTSAVSPPAIPASIADAVLGITGLQPYLIAEHCLIPSNLQKASTALTGHPPSYSYNNMYYMTPADIRALYNAPSNLTGSGQTVAIIMDALVNVNDLNAYEGGANSFTGNSFTGSFANPTVGTPPVSNNSTPTVVAAVEEANLDVETVAGIAPAANIRLYTIPSLTAASIESGLSAIISDIQHGFPNITVISMSFAGAEEAIFSTSDLNTMDQLFLAATAIGVTNLAGSGDYGYLQPVGTSYLNQVGYPASDPYVTGVGGTTYHTDVTQPLALNSNTQLSFSDYIGETVFTEYTSNGGTTVASGGGVSQYFHRPAWQNGNGTLLSSETYRCVPDVSGPFGYMIDHSSASDNQGNATWEASSAVMFTNNDSVYPYGSQRVLQAVQGTSLATPAFAGIVALINQDRGSSGPIGYLNPWLYQIAGNYSIGGVVWNGLTDISTNFTNLLGDLLPFGTNDYYNYVFSFSYINGSQGNGEYTVGPGYDLCTGLGTPNIPNMAGILQAGIYTVQPQNQTVAVGSSVVFSAFAEISPYDIVPATYQWYWYHNGSATSLSANSYAQSPQLLVASSNTQLANNGDQYYCVVTITGTNVVITTFTASLTVETTSNIGHFSGLSTRGWVNTSSPYGGDGLMIGGCYVLGTGTYPLLVRADGPTLASYGISDALPDPALTVDNVSGSPIASNYIWGGSSVLSNAFADVYAAPWATNSHDSAILFASGQSSPALASLSLNGSGATAYTQLIQGNSGDNGVAMIELWDANPVIGATWTAGMPFISSFSTRGVVGTGSNIMIGGIVVSGATSRTLLIEATGPTLGASPFNLPGALPDPQITLFNSSGTAFASNEGWNNNPLIVAEASAAYAYPFPATSKDSAMVVTLPPGIYTVEIVGAGGDSGMAEFSVYLLQ